MGLGAVAKDLLLDLDQGTRTSIMGLGCGQAPSAPGQDHCQRGPPGIRFSYQGPPFDSANLKIQAPNLKIPAPMTTDSSQS